MKRKAKRIVEYRGDDRREEKKIEEKRREKKRIEEERRETKRREE